GKASSMVAVALGPQPCWQVLDACSAPGNKTGKITACELNKDRVKRLEDTVKYSGASSILSKSFTFSALANFTEDPLYTKVRAAVLQDPSCSCSGTAVDRLDHLLPSFTAAQAAEVTDTPRVKNLAAFQSRALAHALSCKTGRWNMTDHSIITNATYTWSVWVLEGKLRSKIMLALSYQTIWNLPLIGECKVMQRL
ncbi:hypothetical protein MKW94_029967, partial [Papaver nudicaule]|nr:hypothetical protein [Papaver nudicaule]